MRILILSIAFPPDGVSTARNIADLAVDLSAADHDISVISTMPHYNRDHDAEAAQPIRKGLLAGHSTFEGMAVRHVRMGSKSSGSVGRALQWLWYHLVSTAIALRQGRPDVVLVVSPPLTMGLNGWLAGRMGRVPLIFAVWELFPDIAVALGYLGNKRIISALHRLERFIYKRSDAVAVLSENLQRTIVDEGRAAAGRVHVIPIPTPPPPADSGPPGEFGRRHGISEDFVVCYAGNMGPAQRLDDLVDAAQLLDDVRVLLVGGGADYERLAARVRDESIAACTVLPHQPYSAVPAIDSITSIGVVPLAEGLTSEALPSKVYRLMARAKPIIAVTERGSALADLVNNAQCGLVVPPGEPSALADAVRSLQGDPARLQSMGESGRAFAIEHHSRDAVLRQYLDLIDSLTP